MITPAFPYAAGAVATAGIVSAEAGSISLTEGAIASAVVGVSMFWIRRADADARRERAEMRRGLHRGARINAVLVKALNDAGVPLPDEYIAILNEDDKETP